MTQTNNVIFNSTIEEDLISSLADIENMMHSEDPYEDLCNFGLCIDYKGSYLIWQITFGGPNVAYKIYLDQSSEIEKVIYYRSWVSYEERELTHDQLQIFINAFTCLVYDIPEFLISQIEKYQN